MKLLIALIILIPACKPKPTVIEPITTPKEPTYQTPTMKDPVYYKNDMGICFDTASGTQVPCPKELK